jgi:hypothetical protein
MNMNTPLSGPHFALISICRAAVRELGGQLTESILQIADPFQRKTTAQMGLVSLVSIVNQVMMERWEEYSEDEKSAVFCPSYILHLLVGELEQRAVDAWVRDENSREATRFLCSDVDGLHAFAHSLREATANITFEGDLLSTLAEFRQAVDRKIDVPDFIPVSMDEVFEDE